MNSELARLQRERDVLLRQRDAAASMTDIEAWSSADRALQRNEVAMALANGVSAAAVIDWPVRWSPGAADPQIRADAQSCYLCYRPQDQDILRNPAQALAIIRWTECMAIGLNSAYNHESLERHPLAGRGLRLYEAHVVDGSEWLISSRSLRVDPDHLLSHYLLTFHGGIFECIAAGYVWARMDPRDLPKLMDNDYAPPTGWSG